MINQVSTLIIAVLNILTGIGIALFWILFLTTDKLKQEDSPEGWLAHERSFVLPDMVLALTLIAAGILLLARNPAGEKLSLVSSGGLIFLGIIDCAYNIGNRLPPGGILEFIKKHPHIIWVLFYGFFLLLRFI